MTNTRPQPLPDRRSVVEAFAQTLSDIRQAAGQPSFRQMAQTSGCISHATLHEATRGKRLPTWETTEQFLIACSADPASWRDEWQRADRLINRRVAAVPVKRAEPDPTTSNEQLDSAQRSTEPMPVGVRMRHVAQRPGATKAVLSAVLAAVLLLATGYALALWTRPNTSAATPTAPQNSQAPMAAEVEGVAKGGAPAQVSRSQERTVGSVHCAKEGEPSVREFGSAAGHGLKYQDAEPRRLCSTVAARSNVRMEFALKNTGSHVMAGWKLHLVRSTGNCLQDGDRVAPILGTVKPGGTYTLALTFTAPDQPGECSAEYEPRDASGKRVFAEGSNVPFAVVVE